MLARALADYDELDGLNVPVPGGYQVQLAMSCSHAKLLDKLITTSACASLPSTQVPESWNTWGPQAVLLKLSTAACHRCWRTAWPKG